MSGSVPGLAREELHEALPVPSHTPEMSGCLDASGIAGRFEQPDRKVTVLNKLANAIKN